MALSKMVLNHELARVVLAEQLYRVYTDGWGRLPPLVKHIQPLDCGWFCCAEDVNGFLQGQNWDCQILAYRVLIEPLLNINLHVNLSGRCDKLGQSQF